jgi:hypothetical protein
MEIITIDSTPKTPSIKFDARKGTLELKGRSIPENSKEFYKSLLESLDQYSSNPISPTQVNIQLEYFNTASSKYILDMLKCFEKLHKKGIEVNINWYYDADDEHMQNFGKDFQEKVSIVFNFVKIN